MFRIMLLFATLYFLAVTSARAAEMSFTDQSELSGGKLWLPCKPFGKCMIDTGGASGNLISGQSPQAQQLEKIRSTSISTVDGDKVCDLVKIQQLIVADLEIPNPGDTFRCDVLPLTNNPMFGFTIFFNKKFEFNFRWNRFSWLFRPLTKKPISLVNLSPWVGFAAKIGETSVNAVFDTGAIVTTIDSSFFQLHRHLFSAQTTQKGSYRIGSVIQPFTVDGYDIRGNGKIFIIDLKRSLGPHSPDVFIGMNMIRTAVWRFDYSIGKFEIEQ